MSRLEGATVLVTGGAGTIGSTLVDQLVDAGVGHVDVLDNLVRGRLANLDDALASGRVALVEGDIRDRDLVNDVTRGKDLVFHQAAIRITQCAEEPRLALEVLVRWMERIADGKPPLIFGDGQQTMDFVFTSDIARANVLAASSDVTEGVYNIARGEETSLLDLARALLGVMGSDLAVEHGPERAVNGVVRRLADTSAARRDLGFVAEVGVEEGLRQLVEWWAPLREEIAAGRDLAVAR